MWEDNGSLTGDINRLRVLDETLEMVTIASCQRIEGNFIDLADIPCLKELDLLRAAATGDIRETDEQDFSALEQLALPASTVELG